MGGVSGVGKSTVINGALELWGGEVEIRKGSVLMAEFLGLKNTDQIKYQDPLKRRAARAYSIKKRLEMNGDAIFDGHFLIPAQSGYEKVFPEKYVERISAMCLVEAPAIRVLSNREGDATRDRVVQDLDQITQYAFEERSEAVRISREYEVSLWFIENESLNEAVAGMVGVFEEVFDANRH